jgi:hypothetical protein
MKCSSLCGNGKQKARCCNSVTRSWIFFGGNRERILWIHFRRFWTHGYIPDGGATQRSLLISLKSKSLSTPNPDSELNEITISYAFFGEEVYSLRQDFIKPYNQEELMYDRRTYNYMLSRTPSYWTCVTKHVLQFNMRSTVTKFGIFKISINP